MSQENLNDATVHRSVDQQQACSAALCFTQLAEVVNMTDYHPRKTHGVAMLVMGADAETVAAELEYIAWALRDGKTEWQGRAQGRLITRIAYGQPTNTDPAQKASPKPPALAPCKYCGGKGEDIWTSPVENTDVIRCVECGAETEGHEPGTHQHIQAWNNGEALSNADTIAAKKAQGFD